MSTGKYLRASDVVSVWARDIAEMAEFKGFLRARILPPFSIRGHKIRSAGSSPPGVKPVGFRRNCLPKRFTPPGFFCHAPVVQSRPQKERGSVPRKPPVSAAGGANRFLQLDFAISARRTACERSKVRRFFLPNLPETRLPS